MPSFTKHKIAYIFGFAVLALVGIYSVFLSATSPRFKYELKAESIGGEEQPLKTETQQKAINFSIKYLLGEGESVSARLDSGANIVFRGRFPLMYPIISYSDDLTVRLSASDESDEDSRVLYTLTGVISNLQKTAYKVRVVDAYGNLIDEKYVNLAPQPVL